MKKQIKARRKRKVSRRKPGKDRRHVLPLKGKIDRRVSPKVAESLQALIEKKPRRLIVDLARVPHLDDTGLAVLMEGMQTVEEYGGAFALAGVRGDVRTIFEIAKLDQVFQIFPDVDAALAAA
jgi:anti-sigma B factor antagonist